MKFKQAICIFLSIIILSGSAGISLAAYAVTDTAEVTLTGQSAINGFEIYNGVLVKYSGLSSNVVIPTGVTKIRGLAFADCPNVMRIYIPASVTVIEKNVFFSLKSPHEINIDIDSGNNNYTIEDGVVFDKEKTRLILCSAKKIGKYSIPKTVINIEDNAFLGCKKLTNIEIPKSVTSIGSNAFMACTKLTEVTIPTSVISMNFSAFEGTPWLVNYPNDFVVAGNGILLCYKGSKKNVKIPNNVKSIGALAFSNCKELESVDIPFSVTSIGDEAFYVHIYDDLEGNMFISKLTNVTMPASITSIGDGAFLECQKLTNIKIPASVTSIGNGAFKGCQILSNIEIPDSVTFIGGGAFEECGMLSSIKIPDSVICIGDRTFYGCQSLTSIKTSENITSIGDDAFFGTPWFNNFKDDFVVTGNHILVGYKGTETKVKIPTNVKSIADGALSDLKNITDATIPIGIKAISNHMFSECRKLQSVIIPKSVTVIGEGAFSTCVRLTNVILPDSIKMIGKSAFDFCGLERINIPKGIKAIEADTFFFCTNLKSVSIPNSVKTIGSNAFSNCKILVSVNIPGSVTSISNNAFSSCWKLSNVTIENGVKSIGHSAFESCWVLKSISFPNSIETIDKFAFIYGTSLNNITVDSGNKNFSSLDGVLYNKGKTSLILCPAKKSGKLVIPKTVTTIEDYSFYLCKNLKNIKIPTSVTNIGYNAFSWSGWLENYHSKFVVVNNILIDYNSFDKIVSIPRRVKIIWKGAFDLFNVLTIVKIPNSVTKIEDFAFYNSKVENVIIPSSVISIGEKALISENNIFKIYCPAGSFAEAYAKRNNLPYSNDLSVAERMLYPRDKIIVIIGLLSLLTAVIFIAAIVLIKKRKKKMKKEAII